MDEEIAAYLENIAPVDRQELFNSILQAKTDISKLTTLQVLKKDMKICAGIPISSVPAKLIDLQDRTDFVNSLNEFLKIYKSTVAILVGARYKDGGMIRDLAVYGKTPEAEKFSKALMSTDESDLKLEEVVDPGVKFLRLFKMRNEKATRKQIVPIVLKASIV